VFKAAIFTLKYPICNSPKQSLAWGVYVDNNLPGLKITCNICHAVLLVPNRHFKALITVEKPYPEGRLEETQEPTEKMGEIIHLRVVPPPQPDDPAPPPEQPPSEGEPKP